MGNVIEQFKSKRNLKVEDTHTRKTFLIENSLWDEIEKYEKKAGGRGFKTYLVNYALRKSLDEIKGGKTFHVD